MNKNKEMVIKRNLVIFDSPQAMAIHVADELISALKNTQKENFYLAISGGSTPKVLFKLLATTAYSEKIIWNKLMIFWVDERCVAPDDPESNFGMTEQLLFENVKIPRDNIHRIKGESNPVNEAARYAKLVNQILPASENNYPQFDWVLLGMGADGHTASLFPNQKLEHIAENLFGVATHPQSGQKRISMTEELINNSSRVTFFISGEEKADKIKEIFTDHASGNKYPAAMVHSLDEKSDWYLDKSAAKFLK